MRYCDQCRTWFHIKCLLRIEARVPNKYWSPPRRPARLPYTVYKGYDDAPGMAPVNDQLLWAALTRIPIYRGETLGDRYKTTFDSYEVLQTAVRAASQRHTCPTHLMAWLAEHLVVEGKATARKFDLLSAYTTLRARRFSMYSCPYCPALV